MPEPAPEGILPIFLRGVTCEKYGFKTGENVMDLVDYLYIPKEELMKEIQGLGVMSDFEPAKKVVDAFKGENILFVIDKEQKYGEVFLICYTEASEENYMRGIREQQEAIEAQRRAEEEAEEARKAAEWARLNVVYEDKPITPRPWVSATSTESDLEIRMLVPPPAREVISIEVSRQKRFLKQSVRLADRLADQGGVSEFRAYKDVNFKQIKESDCGFQMAPLSSESSAQTTWYKPVNKSVQYEAASIGTDPMEGDTKDSLLSFLERITVRLENALQQNESVDIFHETFRLVDDDDAQEAQADNELRELKNFGDPTYSKSKAIVCMDWMPKMQGMVAVSPVRNISFDQRVVISGQTFPAYVLLWDFRQLVKPQVLMQSQHEIFAFRFNPSVPTIAVGGCITGQVVLWDISEALASAMRRNNRQQHEEDDDSSAGPVLPKYVSHVDYSHKRCVSDLFWLPANTQINYRGQLVGQEHLDGHCHQFVTISGDGMVMVWDTRFEQIALDELRHIGRAKHIPQEKAQSKEAAMKPLWAPIFKAHLKRLEGVGELSLNRVSYTGALRPTVSSKSALPGDIRSHLLIGTEEGEVMFADLSSRKADSGGKDDEEDDNEAGREFVRWLADDHARPAVGLQLSPFFPDILLSVSDWCFHIWKIGDERPLFVSPQSNLYLTAGTWSPSRPAVIFVACADGTMLAWDFTDSSFHPSLELRATTPARLTSMEFLTGSSASSRSQLLAAGDDMGTLHIFEVPRTLVKPMHKEEEFMAAFIEREQQRLRYLKEAAVADTHTSSHGGHDDGVGFGGGGSDPVGGGAGETKGAEGTGNEESLRAAEAQKKLDDEFAKLEALFITELGLLPDDIPSFAKM